MKKARLKDILIVLLISVTAFSAYKYISALKEKYALKEQLLEAKAREQSLEEARERIILELDAERLRKDDFRENLRASRVRLERLFREAHNLQKQTEEIGSANLLLKAENVILREQKAKLNSQLVQAGEEKAVLMSRFESLAELKKAIRELRVKLRSTPVPRAKPKEAQKAEESGGNQGYVIKDGEYTYSKAGRKLNIEVTPVEAKDDAK